MVAAVVVVSLNPQVLYMYWHVLYMYWNKDLGVGHCYLGCTGEEVGELRCVEI